MNKVPSIFLMTLSFIILTSCSNKLKDRIQELENENKELKQKLDNKFSFGSIWGKINNTIIEQELNYSNSDLTIEEYESKLLYQLKDSISAEKYLQIERLILSINEHIDLLNSTFEKIVFLNGGRDKEGNILNSRNTSLPDKILVHDGYGAKIHNSMINNINLCHTLLKDYGYSNDEVELTMKIYSDHIEKGKSWEEFVFSRMPIGALEPIFLKLKNDAKLTKIDVLNEVNKKINP